MVEKNESFIRKKKVKGIGAFGPELFSARGVQAGKSRMESRAVEGRVANRAASYDPRSKVYKFNLFTIFKCYR